MVDFLTEKKSEIVGGGHNYSRIVQSCDPSRPKCRFHRNLTRPDSEKHIFIGLQSVFDGQYHYISFRNTDNIPFNPLNKGYDKNKLDEIYGNATIFGEFNSDEDLSYNKSTYNMSLIPLDKLDCEELDKKN